MYTRRRRGYFWLMGGCLVLFVSAWAFVRFWSVPAAIALCVVAMVIPPIAAMIGNGRGRDDRWWDDPSGDPQSDQWWAELDRRGERDRRGGHGNGHRGDHDDRGRRGQ